VDQFVLECRRRVQLEDFRDDLSVYLKILRNAMIELINKDYADFVNLSSNLVRNLKTLITVELFRDWLKVILYSYLILKKMNERIIDS